MPTYLVSAAPGADAQCEVVERAADDGVGTVVQRLERRYVAVSPHEHHRSAGKVVGQPRRRLAGGGGVLENCSRKSFGGVSGESKNCPGKMSGVPNTS
jgi:hypothetical protein